MNLNLIFQFQNLNFLPIGLKISLEMPVEKADKTALETTSCFG